MKLYDITSFRNAQGKASHCTKGKTEHLTFGELEHFIFQEAWSHSTFVNSYRSVENFISTELIVLDIDEGLTYSDACEIFKNYKHIIGHSKSHQKVKNAGTPSEQPACDRVRVVLFLSEKVTDPEVYKHTWQTVSMLAPSLDKSAKDVSRFWFPCVVNNNVYSSNPNGNLIDVVKSSPRIQISTTALVPVQTVRLTKKYSDDTAKFLIEGASPGEWNNNLFRAAANLKDCNYSFEETTEKLMIPTRLPGNKGALDSADLATIKSAFNQPVKISKRAQEVSDNTYIDEALNSKELIWPFMRYKDKNNQDVIYRYTEARGSKKVITITASRPSELANLIYSSKTRPDIKESIEKVREHINIGRFEELDEFQMVGMIYYRWLLQSRFVIDSEPKYITFDKSEICFMCFDRTLIVPGPTPAWDEFLNRLDAKNKGSSQVFLAWTWAILESKNKNRQVLWLKGRGFDGKSVVASVISRMLGEASSTINKEDLDSRFFYSQIYGKRFLVYGDCKNPHLLRTEKIQNITGGDMVTIEYKGKTPFSSQIHSKILVCSNEVPFISDAPNERSRIIFLEVAQQNDNIGDNVWPEQLWDERFQFLHKAEEAYKKLCPKHGQITISDELKDLIDNKCGDTEEDLILEFISKQVTFESNSSVPVTVLHNKFKAYFKEKNGKEPSDFVTSKLNKILDDRHNVPKKRTSSGTRPRCFVGCRLLSTGELSAFDEALTEGLKLGVETLVDLEHVDKVLGEKKQEELIQFKQSHTRKG